GIWGLARLVRRGQLWDRAAIALIMGVGGLSLAIWPCVLLWVDAMPFLERIRLLMAGVSLMVLLVTVESIRRYRLRERYAIIWVLTGAVIMLCAFFPELLRIFSLWFGMQYVTTVVAIVFTFLILVAFHFSTALSMARDNLARLAQQSAILETRLNNLEQRLDKAAASKPSQLTDSSA
ncbi:MAG: DUF2304 domain-containing protein, partial [bacterium]